MPPGADLPGALDLEWGKPLLARPVPDQLCLSTKGAGVGTEWGGGVLLPEVTLSPVLPPSEQGSGHNRNNDNKLISIVCQALC